jgi:hypothetical protein
MNPSEIPKPDEQREPSRRQYVERLKEHALTELRHRFEKPEDGLQVFPEKRDRVLDFHTSFHTEDIICRTKMILEAIKEACPELVDETTVEDGEIAAAFHDIIQEWEAESILSGSGQSLVCKIIRKRESGKNELASVQTALNFLDRLEEETGKKLFSTKSRTHIQEAILATIPSFKDGTVIQKNVTERSSPVARSLALADIGAAGMDGAEAFNTAGDALFREDNIDIARAIAGKGLLSESTQTSFANRMKSWTHDQIAFAEGRKRLFESEIAPLPKPAQDAVRAIFNKFDETIKSAKVYSEKRARMSFKELITDFGYTV